MIEKGIVMEVKGRKVGIMTQTGEFCYVKHKGNAVIGQECTGEKIEKTNAKNIFIRRMSIAAASFMIAVLAGYQMPVSAVEVSINPKVKLSVNAFNKVVGVTPMNEDGKKIVEAVRLKNMEVNQALGVIVDEAKKEQYITEENDKTVNISISGITKERIKLQAFEDKMKSQGIKFNDGNEAVDRSQVNDKKPDDSQVDKKAAETGKSQNNNQVQQGSSKDEVDNGRADGGKQTTNGSDNDKHAGSSQGNDKSQNNNSKNEKNNKSNEKNNKNNDKNNGKGQEKQKEKYE